MSQPNQTVDITLKVTSDDSSIKRAQDSLDRLRKTQKELSESFLRGDIDAEKFRKELAESEKQARDYEKALRQLEKTTKDLGTATTTSTGDLQSANDRFDAVSRDVGLAGDVESNLRTVGGAVGAFGGGAGVEQGIGASAEIFAVVEALPRLKESIAAFPQTLSAAGQSLGVSGAALGGSLAVLGGIFVGVQIGTQLFGQAIKDLGTQITGIVDASRAVSEEIISGQLTTEEARQRIATNKQLIEDERQRLSDLRDAYKKFEELAGPVLSFFVKLGLFGEAEDALVESIKESETRLQSLTQETSEYNRAIEEGRLTENDAKAQVQESAQVQVDTALQQVQAIQTTTQATQVRTEAETQLTSALQVGAQAAVESAFDRRMRERDEYNAMVKERRAQRKAERAERKKQRAEEAKQAQDAFMDYMDGIRKAQFDYFNSEAKAQRGHLDRLEDIRRNAQRSEADAIRSGDIFAIRDIREDLAQSFEDAQIEEARRAREAQIDFRLGLAQQAANAGDLGQAAFQTGIANQVASAGIVINVTNADPAQTAALIQRQLASTVLR